MTRRACIDCSAVYAGGLNCPACGRPGEPVAGPGRPRLPAGTARHQGASWVARVSHAEFEQIEAARLARGVSRAGLLLLLLDLVDGNRAT